MESMGRSNRIMQVTMKRKLFLILTIAAMVGCQKNEIVEAFSFWMHKLLVLGYLLESLADKKGHFVLYREFPMLI